MPRPFVLPDLGEGLQEAEIVKVLVAEGDVIAEDAPLLEVETDKAQVEIPSPFAGRVAKVHVRPGQSVRVGEVLVTFADAGAGAAVPVAAAATSVAAAAPARTAASVSAPNGKQAATTTTGPVPATPSTRRLARELGVDLRSVRATGPAEVRAVGTDRAPAAVTPAAHDRRAHGAVRADRSPRHALRQGRHYRATGADEAQCRARARARRDPHDHRLHPQGGRPVA